mgnify:CR=1 FL=1
MEHHNLRQPGPGQASLPDEEAVNLGGLEEAVKDSSILQVELSDGSVSINFAPHVKLLPAASRERPGDFRHELHCLVVLSKICTERCELPTNVG